MANIINAIINLVENPKFKLIHRGSSTNRANSMGEALEEYIKDIFAGTIDTTDQQLRLKVLQNCFSYLGNQNNPPDVMLRGGNLGDAIEIKKIEKKANSLALNSSYPKSKLFSSNQQIKKACKECEIWSERDMIYAVGVVDEQNKSLTHLCLVYGVDYCADKETYEQIRMTIKNGVESIAGVEFTESKELGHVNRVDPLGITYLRVRGMWGIENPFTVFDYVYTPVNNASFNFMCLINSEKFDSFDNTQELVRLAQKTSNLEIKEVSIKDPNNPVKLKDAKLITFSFGEKK